MVSEQQLLKELNVGDGTQVAKSAAAAQQREEASKGFLGEMWDSAKYSGAQAPVHGLTQIVDRTFGTNLTKTFTFAERPKEATNFADWHAQQIGGALGVVLPFAALNFGIGKGVDKFLAWKNGAQTAESIGMMSMKRAVLQSAAAGAVYEGVFNPSAENESLLWGRTKNATHGALTFGTLTAAARGLHDYGIMKNRLGIGVVSGIPAGIVSAQSDSFLHGKGPAGLDDTIKGAYSFAMIGGVLSAMHSIPLGEKGSKAPVDGKVEAKPGVPADGKIAPVEFRIANEQSRQALEAFRRGETQTAWAEVLQAGEPKRLLVQHEGQIPFELGTRADMVALCNCPEISPFARKLVMPEATDRPIFMDILGDGKTEGKVRFATEKLSPEAIKLGARENVAKVKSLLDRFGIQPEDVPPWLGEFKPTGKVWSGNNATVIELATREGMPDVVLKVKRSDFEGQRAWEPNIYDHKGEVDPNAVHETTNRHSDEPLYMFLEDRVDYNHPDTNGYGDLMYLLGENGLQVSDPGSGPPIGRSRNTGKWVVADRDAVSKIGSGEHEVERAMSMGQEEFEAQREAEEARPERWEDEHQVFDGDSEAARQAAIRGYKLDAANVAEARKVFGVENPAEAVKNLVDQMTDGLSSKEDVHIMQTYSFAEGNEAAATKQMQFVARLLRDAKIPRNDWVDRMAK